VSSLKDFLSLIISAERENTSPGNPAIGDFGPVGNCWSGEESDIRGSVVGRAIQLRIANDFIFELIGEDRKKTGSLEVDFKISPDGRFMPTFTSTGQHHSRRFR
jgi:hypothetical protein